MQESLLAPTLTEISHTTIVFNYSPWCFCTFMQTAPHRLTDQIHLQRPTIMVTNLPFETPIKTTILLHILTQLNMIIVLHLFNIQMQQSTKVTHKKLKCENLQHLSKKSFKVLTLSIRKKPITQETCSLCKSKTCRKLHYEFNKNCNF